MKITFLGDVHGLFDQLRARIERHCSHNPIVQIGDMGLGFKSNDSKRKFHKNFYFIRGNHDSPKICREFFNYLGDFGYNKNCRRRMVNRSKSKERRSKLVARRRTYLRTMLSMFRFVESN